jgi:hypothetical protein
VTHEQARQVARAVIGPAGLLGHLVGRGRWWPTDSSLRAGKIAIGQTMAAAYELLVPLWRLYPQLDPAQRRDALGLARREVVAKDSPTDLSALLEQLKAAVTEALPALVAAFPAEQDLLAGRAAQVCSAADHAAHVVRDAQAAV